MRRWGEVWGWRIILMVLSLNLASLMIAQAGVVPYTAPATQYINGSEYWRAQSWHPSTVFAFGDIISAFTWLFSTLVWLVDGFPQFLQAIGAPSYLVYIGHAIVGFAFMLVIIQFIGGRSME